MSLECSYSVSLMSLSYVVRGYLQSFIAGIVCEDVNGKANESDTLDNRLSHNPCIKNE